MSFYQQLEKLQDKNNSLVAPGLDFDIEKIPAFIKEEEDPAYFFNKEIVDATKDLVCTYKINIPFYETLGIKGLESLEKIIKYIRALGITVVLDTKRNDIGNTATKYAESIFNHYQADATTINPYMGEDSITPFLEYKDKGIFILARTSNPGGKDFQDLIAEGMPVYKHVIKRCLEFNENNNVGFVVGATNPEELKKAREMAPNTTFLIPGIGAQGGDIEATIKNGIREDGKGIIVVSARGIIYASTGEDFAEAARNETLKLRDEINKYRNV